MLDDYRCPFCERNPVGYKRVYENSDFWIAIHEETQTPTAVLKEHRTKIYPDELNEIKRVCKKLFNMENAVIDIKADKHFHLQLLEKELPTIEVSQEDSDEQEAKEKKRKKINKSKKRKD